MLEHLIEAGYLSREELFGHGGVPRWGDLSWTEQIYDHVGGL